MTDFTKYIPKTCVTHHHACDCREAAHAKQVQQLQARIDSLTEALKAEEIFCRKSGDTDRADELAALLEAEK